MATINRVCKICKKEFIGDRNKCDKCRQEEHRSKKQGIFRKSESTPHIPNLTPEQMMPVVIAQEEAKKDAGFKEDPPKESPVPGLKNPTEADIIWWEVNERMGPNWPNWGELVTNVCLNCHKEFQTHLLRLHDCGCRT